MTAVAAAVVTKGVADSNYLNLLYHDEDFKVYAIISSFVRSCVCGVNRIRMQVWVCVLYEREVYDCHGRKCNTGERTNQSRMR